LHDRLGETFTATITYITEHGFYAAIDAPFVEVLCGINFPTRDHYRADPFGTRLFRLHSGTNYALFDCVEVRIADVSIARRKISAVPVGGSRATRPTRAGRGDGGENRRRKRKKHPKQPTKAADRRLSGRTENRKKRREAHPRPSH
jgi:hypothetical protein